VRITAKSPRVDDRIRSPLDLEAEHDVIMEVSIIRDKYCQTAIAKQILLGRYNRASIATYRHKRKDRNGRLFVNVAFYMYITCSAAGQQYDV